MASCMMMSGCGTSSAEQPDLEALFKNPPRSAKAYTWWHWMNGNISKEGITKDLEAMQRAGIGGVQTFNISLMTEGKIPAYSTEEWFDATNHAIKEAERLGIEFTMHNAPGWSSTGGFWITPEHAMKQLSWSEAYVKGGQKVDIQLPQPPKTLDCYWDEALIAYPTVKAGNSIEQNLKTVTVDGKEVEPASLFMNGSDQSMKAEKEVVLEFAEPFVAQSLNGFIEFVPKEVDEATRRMQMMFGMGGPQGKAPMLELSADGKNYTVVGNITMQSACPSYLNFQPTEVKFAKITVNDPLILRGLQLSGAPMNSAFLTKANYAIGGGGFGRRGLTEASFKEIEQEYTIDPTKVLDISQYMNAEGHLSWDAPEGDWTIIRLGYVPIERYTKMGPASGDGLECDKFSKEAMQSHLDFLYPKLIASLESTAKNVKAGLLIDSYEVGNNNWTAKMQQEFEERRGYSMLAYLPALIGKYVGSAETTERFLWDFRRTCADLFADNYVKYTADWCHEHDMVLYIEPYHTTVFDEMQSGARADIPMGEFWVRTGQAVSTLKEAASIAHVNGLRVDSNQIVGAEAYTGWNPDASWQNYPYSLKAQGDDAMTRGLNRFIFHRFAHQPNANDNVLPGMSMGNIGFHFDRTNTWFEKGSEWLKYLSRCQALLQQGTFVGDVLYLLNEEVPEGASSAWNPALPFGYDGDAVNSESFLQKINIQKGNLKTADGINYRVLVLQETRTRLMTIEVLRKIARYVEEGGVLCGKAPVRTPGMTSEAEQKEFETLVNKLWGDMPEATSKRVGKGTVYTTNDLKTVLDARQIVPDLKLSYAEDAPVSYIHRQVGDTDLYFLANHRRTQENIVATFRVNNKRPELWNANTGEIIPLNVYDVLPDGRVKVNISFDPVGSWFVVFREKASEERFVAVERDGKPVIQTADYAVRKNGLYPDVHDNFTISLWIRPESNSSVQSAGGGRPAAMWGSFAASYPYVAGNSEALYGKGHAVAAINATRAGVAVMEKAGSQPLKCVLSYNNKLSSWTHVAVVYKAGAPSIYINGELKATGKASGHTVHPTYKDVKESGNSLYFEGDFKMKVLSESLTASEVKQLFAEGKGCTQIAPQPIDYATDGLLFFENGEYLLKAHQGADQSYSITTIAEPKDLTGNAWQVSFPAGLGAPEQIELAGLSPLQQHADEGVRHFSGTATYSTAFPLSEAELNAGNKLYLDLGEVHVIAGVKLNGKELGITWKAPHRIDITDAVVAGENKLEVEVANLWPNRLIGDAKATMGVPVGENNQGLPEWYRNGEPKPDNGQVTYTVAKFFAADEPLYDSGLVGPVLIRSAVKK